MSIPSETIALPLVKGLDITTDARLVNPPALLEAENTQFAGGGAKKRVGHTSLKVRGPGEPLLGQSNAGWLFGLGTAEDLLRGTGEEDESYWRSANPAVGKLTGVLTRDDEVVAWDGSKLFSYLPSQLASQTQPATMVEGEAVMPSLRASGIAKFNEHQGKAEMADTGSVKIVAWANEDAVAKYAIYDSTTGAMIARGTFSVTTVKYMRAFSLGTWLHVAILDDDNDRVSLFSINSSEPNDITVRSYGDATHFDLYKVSESAAILARTNGSYIRATWISEVGSGLSTASQIEYNIGTVGSPPIPTNLSLISVAVGLLNQVAIVVFEPVIQNLRYYIFNADGTLRKTLTDSTVRTVERVTLAPHLSLTAAGDLLWECFWDDGTHIYANRFWVAAGTLILGATRTRYNQTLASRAWAIGDRTFFWSAFTTALQATWLLLDEGLKPVGHLDFGVADTTGYTGRLTGMNFSGDYETHCALPYKLRVAPKDSTYATSGIYTEASIKEVYLDFLPELRSAQAGRSTYIAGAQLWMYDGQQITEAGFHIAPEATYIPGGPSGNLTVSGTYSYRIDLCHKNAQNEEVRSLSILSNSIELVGTERYIELHIKTLPTRHDDSYFLIYRNAMSSGTPLTEWWLLNSRDPDDPSYLANDLTVASVTYLDDGTVDDTEIQTRELHPATDTYLQPIAAPACEIIASGRDRLWLAGGELPPGVVAPSRLFEPGEVPSFNAYLNIQVDRSIQPITGIGFVGEIAAFFRETSTHLLDSDGPDNVASGLWNPPRLALADVGAVSQASISRISAGLIFQSKAGFRLLGPGGALSPVGQDIDKQARDFDVVGALVHIPEQEVRFYGADGAWVLNYTDGTWAHWTCGCVGVVRTSSGAILAREDGHLWIETPGVYKDGDTTYSQRIRTAWLHGGNIGDFQRVRRVGAVGRYADLEHPDHTVRLEFYYDEREFWEERLEWTLPDTETNQDSWGASNWGAGVWGDTSATINNLEDLTWEIDRRPSRQKCGVFSVAIQDVNTDGPGFELSAFTFELARKSGLNRAPAHGGSDTYR